MGKKCVQLANKVLITLCRSLTYPQNLLPSLLTVGKSGIQSRYLQPQIHSLFLSFGLILSGSLYTVSTTPTITTTCLKTFKDIETVNNVYTKKEIS